MRAEGKGCLVSLSVTTPLTVWVNWPEETTDCNISKQIDRHLKNFKVLNFTSEAASKF